MKVLLGNNEEITLVIVGEETTMITTTTAIKCFINAMYTVSGKSVFSVLDITSTNLDVS